MKKLTILLGALLLLGATGCKSKKKITYDYEGKGTKFSLIEYYYDDKKDKWLESTKTEIIYDELGKIQFGARYSNYKNNKWNNIYSLEEYIYEDGLLVKRLSSSDIAELRINEIIYEFSYINDKLICRIEKEKNKENDEYTIRGKEDYSYDSNNNLIETIKSSYDLNTSTYIIESKEEYTYNSSNLKTTTVEFMNYDSNTQTWSNPVERERIEYDDNNNIKTMYTNYDSMFVESSELGDITHGKIVYDYSDDNKEKLVTIYSLYNDKEKLFSKVEYKYNEDDTTDITRYLYDDEKNEWKLSVKLKKVKELLK